MVEAAPSTAPRLMALLEAVPPPSVDVTAVASPPRSHVEVELEVEVVELAAVSCQPRSQVEVELEVEVVEVAAVSSPPRSQWPLHFLSACLRPLLSPPSRGTVSALWHCPRSSC